MEPMKGPFPIHGGNDAFISPFQDIFGARRDRFVTPGSNGAALRRPGMVGTHRNLERPLITEKYRFYRGIMCGVFIPMLQY